MRTSVTAALLCASFCLAGCFSLDVGRLEKKPGSEHVVVRNYGWTLFRCIPLVCGNANENAAIPWAFFRNDITMDKIQERFTGYVERSGKKVEDLKYTDYDTVMFDIPLVQYPLPIPYLLCYREIQLSGNLK